MPTYNSLVSRTDVQALIPEDVAGEILTYAIEESAAMSLFRRITLSSNMQRMPVLSALPVAYFVAGDTGLKQTTEQAWANKYLHVEEIAAIVPVPEAVLDDSNYDIWGEIRPRLSEAVGRTLDAAIFFGTNKPATWPTDIVTAAIAAGNTFNRGVSTQAQGGIAEDLNQVMGLVEADGFDVNGFVSRRTYKSKLRGVRDTTGQKLLDMSTSSIEGAPIRFVMPGMWPTGAGSTELIAGDWSESVLGVRRDLTFKLLDQGVISDDSGNVIINLPQQDTVALRVVARFAWQVPNPANYDQPTDAARYPFAVLRAP